MPKTQADIDIIAARLKASGTPDSLNRWLTMTPEKLVVTEANVASMVEAANRKDATMPKKPIGEREQALRKMRGAEPTAADVAPAPKPKKTAKRTAAATAKAAAEAAATPAPTKPQKTPKVEDAGKASRHGAKLEIIRKLLARKKGCTSKEVKDACGWPSVSMPQQALALEVTLHKITDAKGVMHYADHPLEAA